MDDEIIAKYVVNEAVYVHRGLRPGLLECVYETALADRLTPAGFQVHRQVPVTFEFDGRVYDDGFFADLIVNDLVLVELKSVAEVAPVHKKQLLTYLRLTQLRLGLLLNFGAELMKQGIVRVINSS